MTEPKHNALVAFAALTALVAKHPVLAEASLYWSYDQESGFQITPRNGGPGLAVFEELAAAVGGSTKSGVAYERGGGRVEPVYLTAVLAGIPLFACIDLPVEQDGAAS